MPGLLQMQALYMHEVCVCGCVCVLGGRGDEKAVWPGTADLSLGDIAQW